MTSTTRGKMLEAARGAFVAHGYAGTSIRRLGRTMGIASSTLYHHFGSKEGVLLAVARPYVDAVDHLLDDDSLARDQERLLAGYLDLVLDDVDLVRFLEQDLEVQHHPEVGARLQAQAEVLRQRLRPTPDVAGDVRAAAAIGALRRPVLRLDGDLRAHRDVLLTAALNALRG